MRVKSLKKKIKSHCRVSETLTDVTIQNNFYIQYVSEQFSCDLPPASPRHTDRNLKLHQSDCIWSTAASSGFRQALNKCWVHVIDLVFHTHSLILFVYVAGLGQLDVSCAQLSWSGELHSILGTWDHDSVADLRQVTADTCKLSRGHLHHTAVLLLLVGQTGGRSATAHRMSTTVTKVKGTVTDYLLEYRVAPHPGPWASSRNPRPSPDLQEQKQRWRWSRAKSSREASIKRNTFYYLQLQTYWGSRKRGRACRRCLLPWEWLCPRFLHTSGSSTYWKSQKLVTNDNRGPKQEKKHQQQVNTETFT